MNIPDGSICVTVPMGGIDTKKRIDAAIADALLAVPASREWLPDNLLMTISLFPHNPEIP